MAHHTTILLAMRKPDLTLYSVEPGLSLQVNNDLDKIKPRNVVDLMPSYYQDQISSRNLMEESRPFPRLGSPPDSTASSPTPSSVESYGERDIGVHPGEKVFNFPTSSNTESGGPVTLTGLTPISPSNEVSTDHNVSSPTNIS